MNRAIEPAEYSSELGKEIMAALHRIANLARARRGFAPSWRLQAKTHPPCPFLRGTIAVGPIGLRTGQAAGIKARDGRLCRRRLYHQGVQYLLGLTALVGIGSGHYDPQRQGAGITR